MLLESCGKKRAGNKLFNMRKLNLGKLRCSTQSAAKNQSLSGSSARDQSQTTISSFFITKHCPVNDPSSSETGRTTAEGNKLTKGAKVCFLVKELFIGTLTLCFETDIDIVVR